ncbi:MAG: AMP-binding protein [Methylococcales bacterium]|nr:AMP-binding protein [Methylococcales bacterium]
MPDEVFALSHCMLTKRQATTKIAYHAGHYYEADQFYSAVNGWVKQLQAQSFERYALFTEDAYPFTVLLFALFHAGKQVWLAGNNRPGTAQQLQLHQCQLIGDWAFDRAFDYKLSSIEVGLFPLSPLDMKATRMVIFTSGSTGEPKPIEKSLLQLQLEINNLQALWGEQLAHSEVLATVSHQHIYGLLFLVLWPLSVGRCFHSHTYINPETLVNSIQNVSACWIASPAHLKRLDQSSPWQNIAQLTAIFSSGGDLHETVTQQIKAYSGQQVIEIYGSSETGGIGWRHHDKLWQLFKGLQLKAIDGHYWLQSPYLLMSHESEGFQLDDQISPLDDGQFIFHGRTDRIVKIEEKRLSLTELELRLCDMSCIIDAYAITITKNRDVVGVGIALSEAGFEELKLKGRNVFIKKIRSHLNQWFEAVVLPRKWLFLDSLPLTNQGKIDQHLLKTLLEADNKKLPLVQTVNVILGSVELTLKVPTELVYFPDHFASYPILPGVVQIAWAEYFGKLFFVIDQPFSLMEVIKFVKIIQPGDELKLSLNWNGSTGKLHFNFYSDLGSHSSGRLLYSKETITR